MASSSSTSSSRQMKHHVFLSFRGEDTRLNFTTHLLKSLQLKELDVFFDERNLKKGEPLSLALSNAISVTNLSIIILSPDYATSKSCLAELSDIMDRKLTEHHFVLPIFYHVNSSDRWKAAFVGVGTLEGWHIGDEFDRPETEHIKNIVEYVIRKLMKHQVFLSFREEDTGFTAHLLKALKDRGINVFTDKWEKFPQAISVSIIVLSANYASSESCLAELSEIMDGKDNHKQIVLPIFYHVDPSDVRNFGGSFKASFYNHESKGIDKVHQWKKAFNQVGNLKGWHIQGDKFDRSDNKYIEDATEYVIKELSRKSRSISEGLVGIDYQRDKILDLIEEKDCRIIGLWGPGGVGKTTLAEAVFHEISPEFQSSFFLKNVRERIKNEGKESVRNDLSNLLENQIEIETSFLSTFIQERLNRIKVIVVLDDVDDSDHINCMGIEYFGDGSKIIVSSRDKQNDSLRLFTTFAFKLPNPPVEFLDLSEKFSSYAQGSPLVLKVLGSKLYGKSIKEWESVVNSLKKIVQPDIYKVLKCSLDGLDEAEKSIFLDIACFFIRYPKIKVENLYYLYEGAKFRISNLVDKCLIDINDGYTSMHDILEEIGKDIVYQESKSDPRKRSRLWSAEDAYQALKNNKETGSVEGIKLDMSQIDNLPLCPSNFKNMFNLRFIQFYYSIWGRMDKKVVDGVDSVSFPDKLRYLSWEYFPFKSLSPNFNPKILVVLKIFHSDVEQLWDGDNLQDLGNLREIDLSSCKKLRKISDLSRAVNLKSLYCNGCESLIQLPSLTHLKSLEELLLCSCKSLRKMPDLSGTINLKTLVCRLCESLVQLPSLNHLTSLETLDILYCTNLENIPDLSGNINLKTLDCRYCKCLVQLPSLGHLTSLQRLKLSDCDNLRNYPSSQITFLCWFLKTAQALNRFQSFHDICDQDDPIGFHSLYDDVDEDDDIDDYYRPVEQVYFEFSNCIKLNRDSKRNIEVNAMLQIRSLAQNWTRELRTDWTCQRKTRFDRFFCCFPEKEISADVFEPRSNNCWLNLNMVPSSCGEKRFLAFAICLVAHLAPCHDVYNLEFYCDYLLTTANGKEVKAECVFSDGYSKYKGNHVFILFCQDMIIMDNDYNEASFEFYITKCDIGDENKYKYLKVKECGVHLFYVNAESYDVTAATEIRPGDNRRLIYNIYDSEEDSDIEEASDDSEEDFDIEEASDDSEEDANSETASDDSATEGEKVLYWLVLLYRISGGLHLASLFSSSFGAQDISCLTQQQRQAFLLRICGGLHLTSLVSASFGAQESGHKQ
ncbi:hypothetical protein GQ457_12G032630 [Hibiscus cannabinus]